MKNNPAALSPQDEKDIQKQIINKKDKEEFPGYPPYPPGKDIYINDKEEEDINPEEVSEIKEPNEKPGMRNEKDFRNDISGGELDVPGTELDDARENIGSEDEENNLYSLGGDKD